MEEIPPSNSARTESPSSSNAELRLTTNHDDGVEVFIPLRERKRLLNKAINDSDHSSRARGTTDRVLPTARFLPLGQLLAQERNTTTAEQFEIPYYSLREDEDRKKHEINNNESDMIELKTMTGATTSLPVLKNYFFPDQAQNVITSSSPTQEGQEPRAKREKRLTLLQLTTSTNSSEKYCVVSQCYFPIEMFSQNHYVNYENLEMFKFVLSDVEDIEEYLAEFYKNNGVNVNEGGVATNLYVCDHVYTCIFNRHEHAMAKYRKLIKYFGLLDISTLNKRMKSYQLSCRDFMTNCLWILFMSIAYLLFIALLCISIWLVEGNYELELLRNSTTISGTNITTSYAGLNEVTFLKYHQPLIVTNENTNSTLGPTEYTLTNLPKWNYLSSFYFTSTTMLTIGYGDYR
ncbi:hypothetical protein FDP41_000681 [Naegleria fowleri]|uniref:Potassium channel domain-containing protein n=1 Tax=Naegleria fowleri TaxID=5763 RepID=A0A6A5CCG4_NAEFO|nr:uncharacterized protein FDP41_000681 [Naegleria fowleri]KAF0984782.1 hypothetical protein FDP41_000681 [Naegleria fowleri]